MHPLIIITGPTTSGKSDAAIALAQKLDSEIVNADSMQVYRYFDIGTAKPSAAARRQVTHHLIDILEPEDAFNAFDFKVRALAHIRDLIGRDKPPILSGGTGLYLKVLMQDFDCAVEVSPAIKQELEEEMQRLGVEALHAALNQVDPAYAARIETTDTLRVRRALGVYRETGKPLSEHHDADASTPYEFPIHLFILQWERQALYDNIDRRVDAMIDMGLVGEVRELLERGVPASAKPMQSIGYAQIVRHLEGTLSLEQAVHEIKRETRHYAKRQLTWFKKVPDGIPIEVNGADSADSLRDKILSWLPQCAAFCLFLLLAFALPGGALADSDFKQGLDRYLKGHAVEAENRFRAVADAGANAEDAKRSLYLLGRIYQEKNEFAKAIEFYNRALKRYDLIEDHIRLSLARAHHSAGQYEKALEQAELLTSKFSRSMTWPEAMLLKGQVLIHLSRFEEALAVLQDAEQTVSRQSFFADFRTLLPEIIHQQAGLKKQSGKLDDAYTLYRKLYVHYPAHPLTLESLEEIQRLSALPEITPVPLDVHERSTRIEGLLEKVRYQQAIEEIRAMEAESTFLESNFYFQLARAHRGLRDRVQANRALKKYLKHYPRHRRTHEAHYNIGRNLWNLGEDEAAVRELKKILGPGKKSDIALKARFVIGKIHEGRKQYDTALKAYRRLVKIYGDEDYAQWGAWRIGWIHYLRGHYDKAANQFGQNVRRYRDGLFAENNLFWQAKALEKRKRNERARTLYARTAADYPYTYYGIRSKERLNGETAASVKTKAEAFEVRTVAFTADEETAVTLKRKLSADESHHRARALELTAVGQFQSAVFEIRQLERTVRKNLNGVMWLSDLYVRARSYSDSVRLLHLYLDFIARTKEKDLSRTFWKNFFPLAYAELIDTHAGDYKIDPFLVKGLIRQESLFDTQSLSPAGARGLMQLMPETGKRLYSAQPGGRPFDKEILHDPEINIELGVKYIGQLQKKFGKHGPHVLISYNAGPHVLKKWLKRFRHIEDPDVFIESIPYPETRKYVKHVLRNHGIYQVLYPQKSTNE